MQIFHKDFKNFLKKILVCSRKGHAMEWIEYQWAPAHGTGIYYHMCRRCEYTDKVRQYHPEIGRCTEEGLFTEYTLKEWKEGKQYDNR